MPEYRYLIEYAEDDGAVHSPPSTHVDYLSHDWREEDIWSSWKLVVSRRKAYEDSTRLENASWRAWAKWKNQLKTISPETLNWFKDCDVTWLYGPLQKGSDTESRPASPVNSSRLSKSNSSFSERPSLKKRSVSERMLQRSLSSSSLLRRAAAAVRSEHSVGLGRPDLEQSNIAAKALVSRPLSGHHTSLLSSGSPDSQSPGSPGHEKRHIHFNEQVEQCIALGMKETGGAAENKGKTIGILPSTTLKYVDSITKPHETTLIHSSRFWYGSQLCPLPAQESCRPTGPEETESEETDSEKTALADNEEEDDIDWLPPSLIGRKNSMIEIQERSKNTLNANSSSHNDENAGTRATPEVFVQNNEDEDARVFGLLGKAVDALNTAKDIAYLIWKDCWPS